jgi:predicted P-loop ATPase
MELDGDSFENPEYFQSYFEDTYSCSVNDKNFLRAINYFARQESYHPIRQYLESLPQKVQPVSLDNLSTRYFGTKDELSNLKVKRWLIGAVARLYTTQSGVKFESALILYGAKQGRGKSSFFEALGQDWHCNDIDDVKGKDNLLKQHSSWILECAEFDGITSKHQCNAIKAWIGIKVDRFREPYGTKTAPHARRFAIAGTVNTVSFLKDETGNRRFSIIDTGSRIIDKNLLAQERDGIWLAAYQAYLAGEKYWFDVDELEAVEESNQKFQEFDDWQGIVEGYLEDTELEIVSTNEILRDRFNILDNAPDYQRQANRLARILTKLKFERYRQFSTKIHDGQKDITIRPMYWVSKYLESALEAGKFEHIHPDILLSELKAFRPDFEVEETRPSRDIAANIAGVSNPVSEQVTELETKNKETIPSRDIAGALNPVTEQVTEVSAMSEAQKTTKKNFLEIPEEKQQRIFLLEVIKAEQDRLEWDDKTLQKTFKRVFPRKSGTDSLTNTELQQFWEHLGQLKSASELKKLQQEREAMLHGDP